MKFCSIFYQKCLQITDSLERFIFHFQETVSPTLPFLLSCLSPTRCTEVYAKPNVYVVGLLDRALVFIIFNSAENTIHYLMSSVRQTDSALSNLSLNIHGHVEIPKSKKN